METVIVIALAVTVIGFTIAALLSATTPRSGRRYVSTSDGSMSTFTDSGSSDWGSGNDSSDCSAGGDSGGSDGGGGGGDGGGGGGGD
jgi:hypothetical protein